MREFGIGDFIDQVPAYRIEWLTAKKLIQPLELGQVFARCGFVRLFLKPSNDRLVPGPPWFLAQLRDAPQLRLQPIVKLLR